MQRRYWMLPTFIPTELSKMQFMISATAIFFGLLASTNCQLSKELANIDLTLKIDNSCPLKVPSISLPQAPRAQWY